MRRRPTTLVFLVLAIVLVDLTLYAEIKLHHNRSVTLFLICAFVSGQVSLVAIWTALGPGFWLWRFGVLAAGLSACGWLLSSAIGVPSGAFSFYIQTVSLSAVQAGILVAASGLLRLSGLRWIDVTERSETHIHNATRQTFQFSLRDVLRLMTFVALALLAARFADFPRYESVTFAVLCLASSLLALLAIWTTFPLRWRVGRLVVYAIVAIALGLAMLLVLDIDHPTEAFVIISFFGLQAFFLLAWLGVCRLAGYRIVRVYQRSEA